MAHSLVPKYYHEAWLQSGNRIPRIAPHEDNEVPLNRSGCFKKLFQNTSDLKKMLNLGFFTRFEYFNKPHMIEARFHEEPLSWWANNGVDKATVEENVVGLEELSLDDPKLKCYIVA
ncbi:hypothetical protein ACS0TY_008778 [Phlomoides rotata]